MSNADKFILFLILAIVAFVTFVVILVREGAVEQNRRVSECAKYNMVLVSGMCVPGFKP